MKSCFFIGHRETGEELYPSLMQAIRKHITEYGVTEFYVGNYGNFDQLAARAVTEAKDQHPQIHLYMLIPYHPALRAVELRQGFDGTFYPPDMETVPHRFAIVRANRYMIDHVDHLIAYVCHPASNAKKMVEYAQRRARKGLITVTLLE